jgi:F-type H+-transporting ATPase subunit gamma
MRAGVAHLQAQPGDPDVEIVGKKGIAYAKFNRIQIEETYTHFGDSPQYADVEALAQQYMDAFIAGKYSSVKIVYMKFVSMSRQTPVVETLLPLEPPKADMEAGSGDASAGKYQAVYEFSPEPEQLLSELLPETVKITLYQAFMDAVVSEQLARMVAMKSATDAAGKQKKSLNRQYNRARQTAITTELSEIIGGAAALE